MQGVSSVMHLLLLFLLYYYYQVSGQHQQTRCSAQGTSSCSYGTVGRGVSLSLMLLKEPWSVTISHKDCMKVIIFSSQCHQHINWAVCLVPTELYHSSMALCRHINTCTLSRPGNMLHSAWHAWHASQCAVKWMRSLLILILLFSIPLLYSINTYTSVLDSLTLLY